MTLMISCDTDKNVDAVFEDYFIKYYGEDGNQEAIDLLVNSDGTMIMLGNSSSQTVSDQKPFITKIDALGNVLWQRQLGHDNNTENAVDVELDNQGNLIVISNIGTDDASRIWLYRLDQQGNGIDSVEFPSNEKQVAKSVTITTGNKFLITGYAAPDPDRNPDLDPALDMSDVIVLEIDDQLENARVFSMEGGGEYEGSGVKIFEQDFDGVSKFLVFSYTDTPADIDVFKLRFDVTRIDLSGTPGDLRAVSGIESETQTLASVVETPASFQEGYLMVGTTYKSDNLLSDIYITQYTKDFVDRVNTNYGFYARRVESVSAAVSEPDAFYILANETRNNNKRDIFLLKTAGDGSLVQTSTFGTLEGEDTAAAVRVLPDKRVVLLGTMELETQKKMVLMIISPDGTFSD